MLIRRGFEVLRVLTLKFALLESGEDTELFSLWPTSLCWLLERLRSFMVTLFDSLYQRQRTLHLLLQIVLCYLLYGRLIIFCWYLFWFIVTCFYGILFNELLQLIGLTLRIGVFADFHGLFDRVFFSSRYQQTEILTPSFRRLQQWLKYLVIFHTNRVIGARIGQQFRLSATRLYIISWHRQQMFLPAA